MICLFCNNDVFEKYVVCDRCNLAKYCNFECLINDENNHYSQCSKIQFENKEDFQIDSWCDLKQFFNKNQTNLFYSKMLQWAMTIFYIITKRLHIDYPQWKNITSNDILNVYIIGVRIEAYYLQEFKILTLLLQNIKEINIFMIGNQIDSKHIGQYKLNERLNIFCIKRLYHDIEDMSLPHLAIAFNAGLPAYQSWIQTLVKLKEQQIPAYFTEYNLSCYILSQQVVANCQYLTERILTEPVRNPFVDNQEIYSPEYGKDSELFSNQWIFALTIK